MPSFDKHQEGSGDITPSQTTARQDTKDEKVPTEGDPDKQQEGDEQTTQIDPAVARRIAANVEDFMVR